MKKYINGEYIELTAEEIEEIEQMRANAPAPELTMAERVQELEEALALILSGVTE